MSVTVVIPTIAPRWKMLTRAVESVARQSRPADAVIISNDVGRIGAAANRDQGLALVGTEWVAFLDDDDELYPHHLRQLTAYAEEHGADLVYPWYDVGSGGTDPFPYLEGVPWSNREPHQVPVTFLARTAAIRDAGGFSYAWDASQGADPGTDAAGNRAGEDYRLILRLAAQGAKIVHYPDRSWIWHHHGANTSGLPSRW